MAGVGHQVTHDPQNHRYVITIDGAEVGYAVYVLESPGDDAPAVRDFNHTVIDPGFRGQGLSSPLIRFALEDTLGADLTYRATCSAVEHFIDKNPGYADGLARPV
ncbi:N-acetyltransferase [Corynebacterium sp. CCM 9185]|uniref:N-acetyltransferase n=1 Tax=Corynebacterium marambiense TaxID=2765364 RepID=A0ABS0W0N1_9CORY|nr:GNAT family N-acetyltransferase [Corynebacterium marambiense]MBI9001137.1 N-acetyltransferase [Corynebacterium marambiense]MCK7664378.1 N-acetyltransferase [Corynebacterium marambiense]